MWSISGGGRGGGGSPLYKPYRYVPPQRVRFMDLFGLKNGYKLCPFWSGSGFGFPGKYRSASMNVVIVSIRNEFRTKCKYVNSKCV